VNSICLALLDLSSITPTLVFLILGAALFALGITGGNIQIKEIRVAPVTGAWRVLSLLTGIAFLALVGLGPLVKSYFPTASAPQTTAQTGNQQSAPLPDTEQNHPDVTNPPPVERYKGRPAPVPAATKDAASATAALVVIPPAAPQAAPLQAAPAVQPTPAPAPVVVDNFVWTDPATNLMWARQDNGTSVSWEEAVAYCQGLNLDGYSDWRLPQMYELRSIYASSIDKPGTWMNGTDVVWHVKGDLVLSGWQWSSTSGGGYPENYFGLNFRNGQQTSNQHGYTPYGATALCVRHR
jgi:hypothetical protein